MVTPNIEIIFITQRFDSFKVIIRSGLNYTLAAKAWFPYGRKRVVTIVEIGLQSISTIVTTLLTTIWKPGL